ncbi:MAG: M23 family metallopeptidase [Clostridiales bacterium]
MVRYYLRNTKVRIFILLTLIMLLFLIFTSAFFSIFTVAAFSSSSDKFLDIPEYSFTKDMILEKSGEKYLDWYFPIADGFEYNYVDTFGAARDFGGVRTHLGIDIMCDEGIPIVAIEGGEVIQIGWNYLGGWRIGINSNDGSRYWYYAHMRKVHPYVKTITKGSKIHSGQVIGYIGSSGYDYTIERNSMPENPNAVDGKFDPHLHLGLELENQGYINPYPLLMYLEKNKMPVKKVSGEYKEMGKSIKQRKISEVKTSKTTKLTSSPKK